MKLENVVLLEEVLDILLPSECDMSHLGQRLCRRVDRILGFTKAQLASAQKKQTPDAIQDLGLDQGPVVCGL